MAAVSKGKIVGKKGKLHIISAYLCISMVSITICMFLWSRKSMTVISKLYQLNFPSKKTGKIAEKHFFPGYSDSSVRKKFEILE